MKDCLRNIYSIANWIWKIIKYSFDWVAIAVGGLAALFIILPTLDSTIWNTIQIVVYAAAGCLGLFYAIFITIVYLANRIAYDWYLVNGSVLRKVVCLVLLTPFALGNIIGGLNKLDIPLTISSPTEIISEKIEVVELQPNEVAPTTFRNLYYHFIDPGNQYMASSDAARFWAAIVAVLGVLLLNGLFVSSIVNAFDKRKERWLNGEIRYTRCQLPNGKFAVVIGANEVAASVIHNLLTPPIKGYINNKCECENRYVILQTKRDAQTVREELLSHLSEDELRRVIIYKGLRDSKSEIEHLHLDACTEIYVLGESTLGCDAETHHDTLNMRCVNLIAHTLNNQDITHRKVCKVMFEYQTTYSVFQFSDIVDKVKNALVFIPFNRYESWARRVMVDGYSVLDNETHDKITYTPLDGQGIGIKSEKYVHLVVVGMSKMGVAIGVQAMLQAHYLNQKRTRITFIDTHAEQEMAFFKGHYANLLELTRYRYMDATQSIDGPWIDSMQDNTCQWSHLSVDGQNFIDLEIEFIQGGVESDGVRNYLQHICQDEDAILTMAICLTQTHQAIAASLYMPICIYEKAQEIWVYQPESADIIQNLYHAKQKDKRYRKLRPFGMLYGEYMDERTQYLKALLVNGAYSLHNIANRDMANRDTYKDLREEWKKLSIDKTFSNRYFVDTIPQKMRAQLLDKETARDLLDDAMARCEHNRWNAQQLLLGYAPCDKSTFEKFCRLNEIQDTEEGKQAYKIMKIACKEGEYRMHPNICDYDSLNKVDKGAKKYDIVLNNAIPQILQLVDNHPSVRIEERIIK